MSAQPESTTTPILPPGLPDPVPLADGLDAGYWEGTRTHELRIQRCRACGTWQWGPEWLCHACHSFDVGFEAVAPTGVLYAWERVWHPTHPALVGKTPYRVALVELPQAGGVRVAGNVVGDPHDALVIGTPVVAVFEDHDDADVPYTLVQWRVTG